MTSPVLKKLLILSLSLFAITQVMAQNADELLTKFLAAQQDEHVFLRWTIKGGNTCDGTRIQRSVDMISYQEIGDIPGICGSPDQPVTYDFTDTLPAKNRINYYRLELGLIGQTTPVAVDFVVLNNEGYTIMPNPVIDQSLLRFDNPDAEEHEFSLVDIRGNLVYSLLTTDDKITIDRNFLRSGTYVFMISKDGVVKNIGKIIVI